MLKELYNVKNPPDQYVVRAVVDKAADKIESAVESRLGFPLDYAEVTPSLHSHTKIKQKTKRHTNCNACPHTRLAGALLFLM